MRPSDAVVSDLLHELQLAAKDIDECLLNGEKVTMIYEAGLIYNQLRELVTPEYFSDAEYLWMKNIGEVWNAEVKRYRVSMGETLNEGHKENLDELENQIRNAWDDLLGPEWTLEEDDDEIQ